jgi:hypothetical protein
MQLDAEAAPVPAFSNDFKSPAFSRSPTTTGGFTCIADNEGRFHATSTGFQLPVFSTVDMTASLRMAARPVPVAHVPVKNTSLKRPSPSDWLSSASTMRKKAALNAAAGGAKTGKGTLTPKELRDRGAAFTFPVDLSGVYTNKQHNTWYTLDSAGKNASFVSGMPFYDDYFNEIRIWDNTEQRARAVEDAEQNLM